MSTPRASTPATPATPRRSRCALALLLACALLLLLPEPASALSLRPLSLEDHVTQAAAVCRGTVLRQECYKNPADGLIYTRASIRVNEPLKGVFPEVVQILHRGGSCDGIDEADGATVPWVPGEERLLFLARRSDRTLHALFGPASAMRLALSPASLQTQSSANLLAQVRALALTEVGDDVTDQAARDASLAAAAPLRPASSPGPDGFLTDPNGIPARFTQPDAGQPIPYLVDADVLPPGMTLSNALLAIEQALAAWTSASSVRFQCEGLQSFGMAASSIAATDGKIRIQTHNSYGFLPNTFILGNGGRASYTTIQQPSGWTTAGRAGSYDFHLSIRGYLVLNHLSPDMQNLTNFAEVVCHEVGHILSLAHSSENQDEPDPHLVDAMMYAYTHFEGRGPTLGAYDLPLIQLAHSLTNTPPSGFQRYLDAVTDIPQPNVPGVNEIALRGFDLQTTNLTVATNTQTGGYGTFSLSNNILKYTPADFYAAPRIDPASGSHYDNILLRFSDGFNASPYVYARVISMSTDSRPSPIGDGIPDNWMSYYFGNIDPAAGPKRGANADFDGDGFSNLQEFLLGSNPTNAASGLKASLTPAGLSWTAKPYEVYEIVGATNLAMPRAAWTLLRAPAAPTNTAASVSLPLTNRTQFIRVLKVP